MKSKTMRFVVFALTVYRDIEPILPTLEFLIGVCFGAVVVFFFELVKNSTLTLLQLVLDYYSCP